MTVVFLYPYLYPPDACIRRKNVVPLHRRKDKRTTAVEMKYTLLIFLRRTMKTLKTNLNEKLTEHFTLREMTTSGLAIRLAVKNNPSQQAKERLKALCENVLEPLTRRFGKIRVVGSYRSQELNKAMGGAKNSQHLLGEAADIHVSSEEQALLMMNFIKDRLDFDQLKLERKMMNGCCWVHVSYVGSKV